MALPISAPANNWGEVVAPGIEYREFHLTDPKNNVYVARMEIANRNVTIESAIAQGYLKAAPGSDPTYGRETVSGMAQRYDDAINYWGIETALAQAEANGLSPETANPYWGTRNDVVVAINGFYFTPSSGWPWEGMVHSGWYAKRYDGNAGSGIGEGFGWTIFRQPFIAECVYHPTYGVDTVNDRFNISVYNGSTLTEKQNFDGINIERDDDQLIIYTPQYYKNTLTDDSGVEVLVELTRPLLIMPWNGSNAVLGTVREIRDGGGSTPLPFDHIVLSAKGAARETLLSYVQVGMQIGINQEVWEYGEDCQGPAETAYFNKTYASLGGDFYFLKAGEIRTYTQGGALERHPRTAVAYNNDYVYFIVVDGRDATSSVGMTIDELAHFAHDTLMATYGIAQDGGGSSTMVINGVVKNNTFCNEYTCNAKVYLPLVVHSASPGQKQATPALASTLAQTAAYERWVANALMMVKIEPKVVSGALYQAGDRVSLAQRANVYLGPGTNYGVIATLSGENGTVQAHTLNGVYAKGAYWWKIRFDNGVEGWVDESALNP